MILKYSHCFSTYYLQNSVLDLFSSRNMWTISYYLQYFWSVLMQRVTGGWCQFRPLHTLGALVSGHWPDHALAKGLCVVRWAPTTVQCCPKEDQSQIHNVRSNVITFPWIVEIILWGIYKRTSTHMEFIVNIFTGLYICQCPCQKCCYSCCKEIYNATHIQKSKSFIAFCNRGLLHQNGDFYDYLVSNCNNITEQ